MHVPLLNRCPLLELELGCSHPTVINELCAECGADLQAEEKNKQRALFSMVHSIPQLKVNEEVFFCNSCSYLFI